MNFSHELNLKQEGYSLIAGIDEAGRGPLAGPVVAAAVIFNVDTVPDDLARLTDSKKLTPRGRELLYTAITERALQWSVGLCDHETIDRINILQAAFLAMKKALGALHTKPSFILIDGRLALPNYTSPQRAVVKGDSTVLSIAAASVIAKVTRDRLMGELHEQYPRYAFIKHKGYGTKLHLDALKRYGPCEIHRKSFAPVKILLRQPI